MKKMFKTLMMAFVAVAAIGVTGCSKDDDTSSTSNPTPTNNTIDLKGTSWVGVYNDTYQNYPAVLTWSLDFTSDTEGELLFELTVAGQQQGNYDVPFTWTFDGTNGTMNAGQMGASQFTYDAATNTIKMMMMVEVEGDGAQLGGMTTFYPRGSQPTPPDNPDQPTYSDSTSVQPGEVTDLFPANTQWVATEETVYPAGEMGDLPMTLTYNLVFRNNHTGFIQIGVTVMGQSSDPQYVWYNWEFDNAANTGNFIVQNAPLPFTYDPSANTITTEFNFNVSGSGQGVGGTLTFTPVEADNAVLSHMPLKVKLK